MMFEEAKELYSWLNDKYILNNGGFPVSDELYSSTPEKFRNESTCFGLIPYKTIDNFNLGDLIIYHRDSCDVEILEEKRLESMVRGWDIPIAIIVPKK